MERDELADRELRWPVLRSREIHRDAWVAVVREDIVTRPGHPDEEFARLSIEHPGAVMILAVDQDEQAVLLRQYRHTAGYEFVEVPAGICDTDGEAPVDTAKRELREEVQLQAEDWRLLLSTWPSAGLLAERHHIFLARGLSFAPRGDFELHAEEAEMTTFRAPMADLLDAVLDGRVTEGPLVQAVLAYDVLSRRGALG